MSTSMFRRRMAQALALVAVLLTGPSPAWAHADGAYWHDTGAAAHNPQWMLTISPAKKLTELSLPGTHDSGTYPGNGGDIAQAQTMTIREQLDSGIRYLDIRLRNYDFLASRNCNDSYTSPNCLLMVFHGPVAYPVFFERDVLRPTLAFLKDNPSETVVMRIAREVADCDCNPGPGLNLLLAKAAGLGGAASQKYADFLVPSSCPDPGSLALGPVRPLNAAPVPASCNARGKLLLLQQYLSQNTGYTLSPGHYYRFNADIDFETPTFDTLRTNFDLYDRLWLPTKAHLAGARSTPPSSKLYFVGIGGSGGGFPYFFASGHSNPATGAPRLSTGLVDGISGDASTYPDFPRTNCAFGLCTISFEGMNTLVADNLLRPDFHLAGSRVGIISADFPGERFITAVAAVNAGVSFNRPSFNYTMTTSDGRAYVPGAWTNQQVLVTPVCSVVCFGNRSSVIEDLPDGFSYTVVGGGSIVSFVTSPVRVDLTPPTLSAAATTPPARNGWYTGNVTVRFTCADAGGSGVADCPGDQVLSKEGTVSSEFRFALDRAGNKSNSSNIVSVRIDKTAPTVSYKGNLGSYAPGQSVDIRCEVLDRESGVASSTCADVRGLAASFGPGTHRFSATATDMAGNTGNGSTSFTVVALPGDVNGDGVLDCRDTAVVKASFGKRAGALGFDARADTNGDGVVDIRDLSFVAQKLPAGSTCP